MYIPCRFPKWENQQITWSKTRLPSRLFDPSEGRANVPWQLQAQQGSQQSLWIYNQSGIHYIYIYHFVISIFIDEIPIILVYIPIKYKFISPLSQVLEG